MLVCSWGGATETSARFRERNYSKAFHSESGGQKQSKFLFVLLLPPPPASAHTLEQVFCYCFLCVEPGKARFSRREFFPLCDAERGGWRREERWSLAKRKRNPQYFDDRRSICPSCHIRLTFDTQRIFPPGLISILSLLFVRPRLRRRRQDSRPAPVCRRRRLGEEAHGGVKQLGKRITTPVSDNGVGSR